MATAMKLFLPALAVLVSLVLPQAATAGLIYEWVPGPGSVEEMREASGGSGYFDLTPTSIGATDTDFTTATINDFNFQFDNGAPAISLSDILSREDPVAVAGILVSITHFEDPAFTDANLVFAAGSADYGSQFVTSGFPLETNSGAWLLSTLVTDPVPIPEPSTLALFGIGLAGLGVMTRRRRKNAALDPMTTR